MKLGSSSNDLLGAVICAILAVSLILAVVLVLIPLAVLLFLTCRQRKLEYETGQVAFSLYRLHNSHLEVGNKVILFKGGLDLKPKKL